MSTIYSSFSEKIFRYVAVLVIVSIIFSLYPAAAQADDGVPLDETSQVITANLEGAEEVNTVDSNLPTEDILTVSASGASSTEDGADAGNGNEQNGENGAGGTTNVPSLVNTSTTTETIAPNGSEGGGGVAGATPDDEVKQIDVVSDGLLGDIDPPEEEDTTGEIRRTATNALIETGIATAQGELTTDANSSDIRSELTTKPVDFDTYTFTATGTNVAAVSNSGLARSISGDNYARGRSTGVVKTGDAVAVFNIANVINTNVVNSDGFIYLANKILEDNQSLDLTESFFPDLTVEQELAKKCSLLSCISEDVVYNISQMNNATITNNAQVEAITGENSVLGDLSANIATGDAYAAANIMNVLNTNIIDSNYRLFTYNAIGDLNGDLVLPTREQFKSFFSRANGISASENNRRGKYENFTVNATNLNTANVDNNLDAKAETGLNKAETSFFSNISTGRAESESNVLNKINQNTYGGDSMYLLIRVHGVWSGEVVGLPEGLTWESTSLGIVIYNEDAEIAPSEFLSPYDLDSYTANFTNENQLTLENNVTLKAVTGLNEIEAVVGSINTGNSFASANVMNIANTNIVGTNWAFAVINILGDFDGNISFTSTDLSLEGAVSAPSYPVGPGGDLTFTYTVTNHSNTTATNVIIDQALQAARSSTNETTQSVSLGTLAPGENKQVTFSAKVNPDISFGTTSVAAYATVTSDQADENPSDNLLQLTINAVKTQPGGGDNGTTTNNGTGTTTSTTTNNGGGTVTNSGGGPSGGGGSSSGGASSKTKSAERENVKKVVDPNSAPWLNIKKTAVNIDKGKTVKAGQSVDYLITVTNSGGNAYAAQVFDVLTNSIGSVMNEQSWDLGTILPGESIKLSYTTEYSSTTPSGDYTNTASLVAYRKDKTKVKNQAPLNVKPAVSVISITGLDLAFGNVEVLAYVPQPNGKTTALILWETSKPSVSQIFYGLSGATSTYSAQALNYGYQKASFKFPTEKVKHAMVINDLQPGKTHAFRIHAANEKFAATSREFSFSIPATVTKLTLANPLPIVAGASTSSPMKVPKPPKAAPVTTPSVKTPI